MSVVLCPHLSVEHYRGGEKWVVALANRLVANGVDVAVRALPYAPDGERRVRVRDVLDDRVPYTEAWRHDLSGFDTAYVFYNPLSKCFFHGTSRTIAGIHSWVYVADELFEPHYGAVPTAVKALYRLVGARELRAFDAVHSVTPAYDSPHPNTVSIPNFVDTRRFRPDRAPLADDFTVLATAAHIPEKGWDTVRAVATRLQERAATRRVGVEPTDAGAITVGRTDGGRRLDGGRTDRGGGVDGRTDRNRPADRRGASGRVDVAEENGRRPGRERPTCVVTTGEGEGAVEGLGFLDEGELADAYTRAHVVLHPARVDTDSMVINEACASGTPVVTTPIATHVRRNEAVLHGRTVDELCAHIERLRREWRRGSVYDARCQRARVEGEAHAIDVIYPQLERLLTGDLGAGGMVERDVDAGLEAGKVVPEADVGPEPEPEFELESGTKSERVEPNA
jgi:glycosyltransferase involved in cell wall biosynthesis